MMIIYICGFNDINKFDPIIRPSNSIIQLNNDNSYKVV